MEVISIDSEYLTLTQFLKHSGLISTGGQAKFFLCENEVLLNGIREDRRGKKLYHDDIIEVAGQKFQIICT